jgi:hypothetical protein
LTCVAAILSADREDGYSAGDDSEEEEERYDDDVEAEDELDGLPILAAAYVKGYNAADTEGRNGE